MILFTTGWINPASGVRSETMVQCLSFTAVPKREYATTLTSLPRLVGAEVIHAETNIPNQLMGLTHSHRVIHFSVSVWRVNPLSIESDTGVCQWDVPAGSHSAVFKFFCTLTA